MTLDEAIKHCEEVVARYEKQAANSMSKEGKEYNCSCASDHRQLAEWLRELKEAKRLLRLAVDEFKKLEDDRECRFNFLCEKCPLYNEGENYCKWRYADEAEKLLKGGDTE